MENSKLKENEQIASYMIDAETGCITDTFLYGDSYKKYSKEDVTVQDTLSEDQLRSS